MDNTQGPAIWYDAAFAARLYVPESTTLQLADRCVMCGLCIPHCPTYRLSQTENESPRGRISLIQGLLKGQLQADAALLKHLDSCLLCRACESKCPSGVPYGQLMDSVRLQLTTEKRASIPWTSRLLLRLFAAGPGTLARLQAGIYLYKWLRLHLLLKYLGYFGLSGLKRLHRLLPAKLEAPARPITLYPADTKVAVRGKVSLFTGCASRLFDQETQRASLFLLNRLGYVVSVPETQVCCGALHQHQGQQAQGHRLAVQNIAAFAHSRSEQILAIASGCSSHLASYPTKVAEQQYNFAAQVEDITTFLARASWPAAYTFAPIEGKVLVHEACLQRNVLKQGPASYELLARIPGLMLEPLQGNEFCCGAAGSQMLSQPAQADQLLAPKLDAANRQQGTILVTTNIGCALHIQAGLRERGQLIEVMHPVTLLARQLRTA